MLQKQRQNAPNRQNECSEANDAEGNKESNRKKPNIIIAGDNIIKNMKGWSMSRKNKVKIYSFPGATIEEMNYFLKSLISRKPDEIIIGKTTCYCCDTSLVFADRPLIEIYFQSFVT